MFKIRLHPNNIWFNLIFEHVQINLREEPAMELKIYYFTYFWSCVLLVAGLTWTFHRSGTVLLCDVFRGDTAIVRAVTRLMDVGFYLISFGYLILTIQTYAPMMTFAQIFEIAGRKLGFFLVILGVLHLFNLLLLVIFRRRGGQSRASEMC